MSTAKTIVVLGGAYAGVHVAHAILKGDKTAKVILVSKNSHFYWNIAAVRAIIPGVLKEEQILQPLAKAFERYPAERVEVVVGAAEKVDFLGKTVAVTLGADHADQPVRNISYDHLVLATGARCAGDVEVPWKAAGTYQELLNNLHSISERVTAASHIVVAGAGSTGVEVAGELGFEFGKTKEIVLVTGDKELLGGDSTAAAARAELTKLNVKIRTEARVESVTKVGDKTKITFVGSSEPIETDLYLPTMGLVPNSEYIDASFLTEKKYVAVDEFYRVKGAECVWACGDIVSTPRAGFMITQKQSAGVAKNILAALAGKPPTPVKLLPIDMFVMATGRSRGVGRMGSIKMFSFMAWLGKGKTLAIERLPGYIDGSVA